MHNVFKDFQGLLKESQRLLDLPLILFDATNS